MIHPGEGQGAVLQVHRGVGTVPGDGEVGKCRTRAAQVDSVHTVLEIGDDITIETGKHKHIRPLTAGQRVGTGPTSQPVRPRIPGQAIIMGRAGQVFDAGQGIARRIATRGRRSKDFAIDARPGPVLLPRPPGDDKAAIGQTGDRGSILVVPRFRIQQKLGPCIDPPRSGPPSPAASEPA